MTNYHHHDNVAAQRSSRLEHLFDASPSPRPAVQQLEIETLEFEFEFELERERPSPSPPLGQRQTRSLLSQDNPSSSSPDNNNSTMLNYRPESFIVDMHHAPRFGHSNRVGLLASSHSEDQVDYAQGIKQFTLFILIPFLLWGLLLLAFKFLYGLPKVGCAAGGQVLDMKELSRSGVSRKERKRRILRSWQLQTTFLIVSVLIPTTTMLLMELGWGNLDMAWRDVQSVMDDAESMAFRGWHVIESLQSVKRQLFQNRLVEELLIKDQDPFEIWCPSASLPANGEARLGVLRDAMETIQDNTIQMVQMFETYVPENTQGFQAVTQVTRYVDDSIDWFFEKDWMLKLLLMILNVVNLLLFLSCYILSKNNIVHAPSRMYLSFVLLPMLSVIAIILLLTTASSGTATLLNADFCAGGPDPGSPQGTIQDAILSFEYASMERGRPMTGKLGLVYEAFAYYSNGCLTEHPLAFMTEYSNRVDEATNYMNELVSILPDNEQTIQALNKECGADVSFLPGTLRELQTHLGTVQGNMRALVDISSCQSISPLVRRITRGVICNESAYGLTWIWSCCFALCVLCFTMLTTRAALFNSVKTKKKREKQPKIKVEKEFEEYKEYMTEYYEDAHEWKMRPKGEKAVEIDFGSQLHLDPTFETHATTKASMDEYDNFSEGAEIDRPYEEDHDGDSSEEDASSEVDISYDSSYESSSDGSDEDSDDEQSAMLSFFVETKSMFAETKSVASSVAKRTIRKFRTLRPLLGGGTSPDRDIEGSLFDGSLYMDSPGRHDAEFAKSDGLWDSMFTPPDNNRGVPLFGSSRILTALTPMAPHKAFSYLARTKATDFDESETDPLTPSKPEPLLSPSEETLRPRQLKMSPFSSKLPKTRKKKFVPTTPETKERRFRFSSADSDDIPGYVKESAPKPPTKAYRRIGRTRASKDYEDDRAG